MAGERGQWCLTWQNLESYWKWLEYANLDILITLTHVGRSTSTVSKPITKHGWNVAVICLGVFHFYQNICGDLIANVKILKKNHRSFKSFWVVRALPFFPEGEPLESSHPHLYLSLFAYTYLPFHFLHVKQHKAFVRGGYPTLNFSAFITISQSSVFCKLPTLCYC